jgi:uncharacterized membrane-anchored protein YjiN (DUF445 family)
MRWVATGLLVFAAGIWIWTRTIVDPSPWVLLVRAASEAAVIGGLADWFAVTALFRHPLGLPIPHTAIVPKNKDRIGQGLARFLRDNFLDPEILAERLRGRRLTLGLAGWMAQRPNRSALAARLTAATPALLGALDDSRLRRLLTDSVREGLSRADLRPITQSLIQGVVDSRPFGQTIDSLIPVLSGWLTAHRATIATVVGRQTGRWIPEAVDARVAGLVVEGLVGWLNELKDPSNPDRKRLEDWISNEIAGFAEGDRLSDLASRARRALSLSAAWEELAGSAWADLRARILADALKPEPRLALEIDRALEGISTALAGDPQLQARLDGIIERFLLDAIAPARSAIAGFVEKTVRSWDGKTLADRIELEAGRDLQFIRINGSIVGALAGAALHLIAPWF